MSGLTCYSSSKTDLDGQCGDAGLDGLSSVTDAHIHAVVLGVVQAKRARFHNDSSCPVFGKKQNKIQSEKNDINTSTDFTSPFFFSKMHA